MKLKLLLNRIELNCMVKTWRKKKLFQTSYRIYILIVYFFFYSSSFRLLLLFANNFFSFYGESTDTHTHSERNNKKQQQQELNRRNPYSIERLSYRMTPSPSSPPPSLLSASQSAIVKMEKNETL